MASAWEDGTEFTGEHELAQGAESRQEAPVVTEAPARARQPRRRRWRIQPPRGSRRGASRRRRAFPPQPRREPGQDGRCGGSRGPRHRRPDRRGTPRRSRVAGAGGPRRALRARGRAYGGAGEVNLGPAGLPILLHCDDEAPTPASKTNDCCPDHIRPPSQSPARSSPARHCEPRRSQPRAGSRTVAPGPARTSAVASIQLSAIGNGAACSSACRLSRLGPWTSQWREGVMRIGVLRERKPDETRVALTPREVAVLAGGSHRRRRAWRGSGRRLSRRSLRQGRCHPVAEGADPRGMQAPPQGQGSAAGRVRGLRPPTTS